MERWVRIKYAYVSKYCKTRMIQGHDEQQCYVQFPELYPKTEKKDHEPKEKKVEEYTQPIVQKPTQDNKKMAKKGVKTA